MYNAKPAIATALSTDAALIALIPKVRMFDGIAVFATAPVYPYLTYEELAVIDSLQADDETVEEEVTFRLHLWGTTSLSTLAGHVDRIMKTAYFTKNYSGDQDEMLERGTIVKHKIMSYSGTFSS